MSPLNMPQSAYRMVSTHLWDLRAHAESKLRCLATAQQQLTTLEGSSARRGRAELRRALIEELRKIVAMTATLQAVAEEALSAAKKLPE